MATGNLDKLNSLRLKLIAESDFSKIMDYFFDHFGENAEFHMLGRPLNDPKHPIMESVPTTAGALLANTGAKLKSVGIHEIRAISLPEHKLIHGSVTMQGHVLVFFYFEDLDVGMICQITDSPPTGIARLTCRREKKRVF